MGWEPITYCEGCQESFDVYMAPGNRLCDACREWQEYMDEIAKDKPDEASQCRK